MNRLAFVAVACALVTTGIVVRREFIGPDRGVQTVVPGRADRPAELIDPDYSLLTSGHRRGPADAPLQVLVFSDMECSVCGWFATRGYPALKAAYGDLVALTYRHWPLDRHPDAYRAAVASECAASQGHFDGFHDAIFRQQRLIGIKAYAQFAIESGLTDTATFAACLRSPASAVAIVEADIRAAEQVGGTGTPTILINGWRLPGGATSATLDSAAASLLGRARSQQ